MGDSQENILTRYGERPRSWWKQLLVTLAIAAVLYWSSASITYKGLAGRGSEVAYGIVYGIFHPDTTLLFDLGEAGVPFLLFETVAIALLGTLLGAILAIPFSFLSSARFLPPWAAFIFRSFVLLIRTIPSLIWALVWIRVTGPGPFCGVVTQSVCSIGMITKMYVAAIEDIDTRILESLDAQGLSAFEKIRFGILPQITANFVSTAIYRFDINIKDATTLGIVGAGGIGASLIQCINSRRWSMVGAFLCGMIALMLLIEYPSTRMRRKLAHG